MFLEPLSRRKLFQLLFYPDILAEIVFSALFSLRSKVRFTLSVWRGSNTKKDENKGGKHTPMRPFGNLVPHAHLLILASCILKFGVSFWCHTFVSPHSSFAQKVVLHFYHLPVYTCTFCPPFWQGENTGRVHLSLFAHLQKIPPQRMLFVSCAMEPLAPVPYLPLLIGHRETRGEREPRWQLRHSCDNIVGWTVLLFK